MKTSEAKDEVLNYLVAKCEGQVYHGPAWTKYSTDWAQGGPIIEREGVCMRFSPKDARGAWYAVMGKNRFLSPDFEGSGPTPLIAAMRCYVASRLGDEIEIPKELI
jgi:hypothetical protein